MSRKGRWVNRDRIPESTTDQPGRSVVATTPTVTFGARGYVRGDTSEEASLVPLPVRENGNDATRPHFSPLRRVHIILWSICLIQH